MNWTLKLRREALKRLAEEKRALFVKLCQRAGLPAPVAEHEFYPGRKWRMDFAWPAEQVALEVEGGVWTGGRHTRGAGFLRDMEKYNAAAAIGWRVLRTTPDKLETDATIRLVQFAMQRMAP